jgi:hypothetical protein
MIITKNHYEQLKSFFKNGKIVVRNTGYKNPDFDRIRFGNLIGFLLIQKE